MKDRQWFYLTMRFFIRRALSVYCREIRVSSGLWLTRTGPLLLASNHPDSFLDAIIIGSRFSKPVYFLARGDAFRRPIVRKILTALKLIPIYRLSEGREHLALNDATFDRCNSVFQEEGIILIFSEGLCVNQWELRPLKKGTARIALTALHSPGKAQHLEILPVSISYDSFRRFGKKVLIDFGDPLPREEILASDREALNIHQFNEMLSSRLLTGISGNRSRMYQRQKKLSDLAGLILLFPLASAGFLIHAPLFFSLRAIARKKTAGTVFYDSVLFGLLLLCYPLYYILLLLAGIFMTTPDFFCFILIIPFLAFSYTKWKSFRLNVFYSVPTG